MSTEGAPRFEAAIEALWREVLTHGHRHKLAFLPGSPRCLGCNIPLKGVGGRILGMTSGLRQSRKNPFLCNLCDDSLPQGGAEVDIAVIFADIRGSTGLAERLGPSAFASLLNRFYRVASDVLLPTLGLIDKMVGDEVVALFFPNSSPHYRSNAVHAAVRLQHVLSSGGEGKAIPVGIGVNAGNAFCGRIGAGEVHDFTALGDTMNTCARLQAQAQPGEIVVRSGLYDGFDSEYPDCERRTVLLRGKEESLDVRVMKARG